MSMYSRKKQFKATSEQIWEKITNPSDNSWRSDIPEVVIENDRFKKHPNSTFKG